MIRRDAGFSLLEMVIAFAIAAVSLSVILGAFGQSARNMSRSEEYLGALSVGESVLARAGVENLITTGRTRDGYSWDVDKKPYVQTEDSAMNRSPIEVTVTVSWGHSADKKLELTTVRLAENND